MGRLAGRDDGPPGSISIEPGALDRQRFILSVADDARVDAAVGNTRALDTEAKIEKRLRGGRCVVSLALDAARQLARRGDVVVETDAPLIPPGMPGLEPAHTMLSTADLAVTVLDPLGQPISNVTVLAHTGTSQFRAKTGAQGRVELGLPRPAISHLIVSPAANFWSRVVPVGPAAPAEMLVTLKPLAPRVFSTQIRSLLALPPQAELCEGAGVSVAVVDSGIAPHPALYVRDGYNTVDAIGDKSAWNQDDSGHGTHCAGLIAAHDPAQGYFGLAPGVELYSVRVFPGGHVSDLIEALDWCVVNGIDIVNMSLSSRRYSAALDQAVQRAFAHGVTVVAAAGNQGSEVAYPARLSHTVGVAAYGHPRMFPADSAHALRVGAFNGFYGAIFSARFSNRGTGVSVIAPGVSIVSTVPEGYAAWDGTSMAAPIVAAHLAKLLSAVKQTPNRQQWQSAYLHQMATSLCWSTGLPPVVEGNGQLLLSAAIG